MNPHSQQYQQAQAAVTDLLRKQTEAKSTGISQRTPACTLRTSCAVCGSVHGKPWSEKAKELCGRGCFWILARHIAWNGASQKVKVFTAAALPLLAKYRTYDKLMAAGRLLDSVKAGR